MTSSPARDTQTVQPTRATRAPLFRVVRVVLLVVAGFVVLGDLMQAFTVVTGRFLLALGGADPRMPLDSLPQLLQAELREGASGTLADADLLLRVLGALPSVLHAVTIAVAVVFLVKALEGIAAGRPFDRRVLVDWRILSIALLAGGIAQGLADTAAVLYLNTRIGLLFGAGLVTPDETDAFLGGDYRAIGTDAPQWPVYLVIGGLVALALTTAFRAGARLEREAEGVV
ncbi:hypothetical protein [Herbiconiux sp. YIM B11900]|uniref:hypothetical protein n=1 Tax=Herbiconiux sp. YIM B11900 TaxID=3404131 RepID=UPI003F83A5C6